jgi:hypothetical protein
VIQTIQGAYYVFAGVLAVLAIQTGGTWYRSPYLWFAQMLGFAVAVFGVALFRSGTRRSGPFIGALISACAAMLLLVWTTANLFAGAVPPVFLIDTGLEFMFACWWAVAAVFTYQVAPTAGSS